MLLLFRYVVSQDFKYMRLEFVFGSPGRWERSRDGYRKVKGSVVAPWISCGHPIDPESGKRITLTTEEGKGTE